MKEKLLFDLILYKGKPVRIVSISEREAMLKDRDGTIFTVDLAELETIDRSNVETR